MMKRITLRPVYRHQIAGLLPALTICGGFGLFGQQTIPNPNGNQATATIPRLVRIGSVFHPVDGLKAAPVESATFYIYKDERDGSPLWQETQNVTVGPDGAYNVLMGSTLPDGIPADLFATGEPRWLGIQFNRPGEPEQARIRLVSVPYALKASDADTLGGHPASDYVLNASAAAASSASSGGALVTSLAAGNPAAATTSKSLKPRTVTGNVNYLPYISDGAGDLGQSVLYQSGGNIGLGTTSPLAPLHVATNGAGNVFLMRMENTNSAGSANFQVYNNAGNRAQVGIYGSAQTPAGSIGTGEAYLYASAPNLDLAAGAAGSSIKFMTGGVTERARFDPNGNLGIGVTSPAARLDVAGNINLTGSILAQGSPVLVLGATIAHQNTGIGYNAGAAASSSNGAYYNTAVGGLALFNNNGSYNTAVGDAALINVGAGNNNIAVGANAGSVLVAGSSNNILIGNGGASSDNGAIRIGTNGTQTSFSAAGIRGVALNSSPLPVMIDSNGQLGTSDALTSLCSALGYSDTFYCKAAMGVIKIAFVTANGYNGNLGGIDGANAKCQSEATAAGLPGSYVAWLSSSTRNPAVGLAKAGPWYATDKSTLIAPNWAALQSGTLTNNFGLTANGGSPPTPYVWTNTNPDGTVVGTAGNFNTCQDWTDGTISNSGGFANLNPQQAGGNWSNYANTGCQQTWSLYCFQQ